MILPRDLEARATYCRDYVNGPLYRCGSGAWYDWGRWLVLALVVIGFAFIFCLLSCLSARRRRKRGQQPMYGTGWVPNNRWAGAPNHNANPQNNEYYAYAQPAPPYSPGPQRGQENGVELQRPQGAYTGPEQYAPPAGPPPGKK